MRGKPKNPPSRSQAIKGKTPLFESIKLLLKNKNFIKLLLCDTFIIGYLNIYSTVINEAFNSYGITDAQISVMGASSTFAGVIGAIFFGWLIDKIRAYKKVFTYLIGTSIVLHFTLLLFAELFIDHAFSIILVFMTLIIMCIIPIFAISMDFICEMCYPIGKIYIN